MTPATIEGPPRRRLGVGAAIVCVVVLVAVSVGIGLVRSIGAQGSGAAAEKVAIAATDVAPPSLYVHVFGAVAHPGLYRLTDGARVVDVVAAAGGMTDSADATAVNLARRVTDGEQLRVPAVGESPPPEAAGGSTSGEGDGRVDLNSADLAALDTLPRVGPAIAQRIIDWRESNGAFTSVDDLLSVPGIGEKMLESLRDLVTV